jgi:hypothetical protein
MESFKAKLAIIGINPFVSVPEKILASLFRQSGKNKGPIPVCGAVNGRSYQQNLVRYKGEWRLYINTSMLKNSPKRIGELIELSIAFDPSDRTLNPPPKLVAALKQYLEAKQKLVPSLQKEIVRYILSLKTEESVDRNVSRAVAFLLGKGSFIGRRKP